MSDDEIFRCAEDLQMKKMEEEEEREIKKRRGGESGVERSGVEWGG